MAQVTTSVYPLDPEFNHSPALGKSRCEFVEQQVGLPGRLWPGREHDAEAAAAGDAVLLVVVLVVRVVVVPAPLRNGNPRTKSRCGE